MPDRVLGDLDQNGVPAGERVLDPAGPPLQSRSVPVDLAGVEHGVAPLAKVHEGGLHGGQDVLDPTDVDVADHGGLGVPGDVVLHEKPVLQNGDLVEAVGLAHDHLAVHGLTAGQELGLGDDGPTASSRSSLATALALGLQPGGALERGDLVARIPTLGAGTGATAASTRSGHGPRSRLDSCIRGGFARRGCGGGILPDGLGVVVGATGLRALATLTT